MNPRVRLSHFALALVFVTGFLIISAQAAPPNLYNQSDYDLVKKWHKEIIGRDMDDPSHRRAISRLDDGTLDLEELRRSFVNSAEAKDRLSPLDRLFWGFLARPATKEEVEVVEKMLLGIKDSLEKQIDRIVGDRENALPGLSGSNLIGDLKKCQTLEEIRKTILWSDEYLDLRIKEMYKRFLGREADASGLANKKKNFRERGKRLFVPEFWRQLRFELIDSAEGQKRFPNLVDRVFLKYYRRYPTDGDRKNLANKREHDLIKIVDPTDAAIRPRIQEVYRWILGFEADQQGLDHWTKQTMQKTQLIYAMLGRPGMMSKEIEPNNCPVLNLVQEFAQLPPDVITGIAVSQLSLVEDLKSRDAIAETEMNLPDELGQDAGHESTIRDLFQDHVLREPTDSECEAILQKVKDQLAKTKGKPADPEALSKNAVLGSKEFSAAAPIRVKAFQDLHQAIFFRAPDQKELEKRTKELNSGVHSIKSLENEYLTSPAFKAEVEKIQQALAKGELPPFESLPLSPEQAKFVAAMVDQLKVLNIDYASLYKNFLGRPATDLETTAILESINKAVGALNLSLLPTGQLDPKAFEAFRKAQTDKLKNLPKIAKDALDGLKKQILASPEFKALAGTREAHLTRLYQEVLGRGPDAGGLKSYLDKMARGDLTIDSIKADMMKSQEYLKYQAALKNYPKLPPLANKPSSDPGTASEKTEDIKSLKDLKFFAKIDWADQIAVKDLKKKVQGDYEEYTGRADFLWAKDEEIFIVSTQDVYGAKCMVAGILIDRPWTPAKYYQGLNQTTNDLLQAVQLNGGAIILSSSNVTLGSDQIPANFKTFIEPVYKGTKIDDFSLSLNLGANILGRLSLNHDPIKKLMSVIKVDLQEVLLNGMLPLNPKKSAFRAYFRRIPIPDWLPGNLQAVQPWMEYEFREEVGHIRLRFSFPLQFDGQEKPIEFEGLIDAQKGFTSYYVLSGGMYGMWENALGIEGLNIGNIFVAFQPATKIISVRGTVQFGTRIIELAATPLPTPGPFPFRGSLNELNLDDLVLVAKKMNIDLRHESLPLPQIGLRDLKLVVSSIDDPPMGFFIGFQFDGRLLFNGEDIAKLHIRQWKTGIEMKGEAKPLAIGPLKINGGTPDEGPMVDGALKPTAAHYYIKGKIDLFGMIREAQVFMNRERIMIDLSQKLWDAYETRTRIEGTLDLKKPAFGVEATMKADFLKALTDVVDAVTKDKTPEFVKKHVKTAFAIEEAGFKGSLDACLNGTVPGFWVKAKCLGKRFSLTTTFNFKDAKKALESLGGDLGKDIIARLEAFAKMMEEKVKAAVKKIKDAIVKAVEAARKVIADLFKKKKKDSSGPSQRSVDARHICYAVYYW
jgi:hypothetical protein